MKTIKYQQIFHKKLCWQELWFYLLNKLVESVMKVYEVPQKLTDRNPLCVMLLEKPSLTFKFCVIEFELRDSLLS